MYKETYGRVGFWGGSKDGELYNGWDRGILWNEHTELKVLVFNMWNRMVLFWKYIGNSGYTVVQ